MHGSETNGNRPHRDLRDWLVPNEYICIYMYIYPWVANYRSNLSAGETSTTGFCVGDTLGNVDYLQTLKAPLRE